MPAKFRVRITRTAERDLEEAWEFIAQDSPEEAEKFIRNLEEHIETLERFPERCPLIAENEILGTRYRHFVYGNYRSVFRIAGKTVYVLRVIHGSRLLDTSMFEEIENLCRLVFTAIPLTTRASRWACQAEIDSESS